MNDQVKNLFMSMLKDKEKVIYELLKDFNTSDANMKAFQSLCELYDSGEQVNADKALKAAAKSLRHLNDVNRRLLLILLVYTSGGDFATDAAKVLVNLGHGEEALQEMFKQKMRGRS